MKFPEFLSASFLQTGSIDNQLHMSSLYETWSVVTRLEAFNSLLIVISGVRQSVNRILSRTILDGLLKVYCLLSIRQNGFAVDSHSELIPELSAVDDVPIKGRHVEFGKFDSCTLDCGRSNSNRCWVKK